MSYRCPSCNSSSDMLVQVTGDAPLRSDGSISAICGQEEYDADSQTWCGACGFEGTLADFAASESSVDQKPAQVTKKQGHKAPAKRGDHR